MLYNKEREQGFTIIELLSVVTIVGILSAIAFPQLKSYKDKSFVARAQSDLRHFAIAEEAYFVDFEVYKSCTGQTCVTLLPGVNALSQGVTLSITATSSGFTATTDHPQISETCRWDSSQEGFIGCT